jgi:hypothetical protein
MLKKAIKYIFEDNIELDEFGTTEANELHKKIGDEKNYKEKQEIEKRIRLAELEKKQINDTGTVSHNFVSFALLIFITIGLTLYLFVFYSSTVYSSFYGNVDSGMGGFIRASVFTEAQEKGSGAISIIVLAPFIFIGLGFLIHSCLKENRALVLRRKKTKYGLLNLLLFLTFAFDALMAYKISESIHNNMYIKGLTDISWNYNLIFSDINFYLVLFSGFVVYVIWGLLLDKVMSDYENSQPEVALKNIENELETLKMDLSALNK